MNKTTFYFIALFLTLQLNLSAQEKNYSLDCCPYSSTETKESAQQLRPVYFSFAQRKLFYDKGMRLNERKFLYQCRQINDPQIKAQIARYDKLTNNKKKLLVAMAACAVGGYITMMGGMVSASGGGYYNQGYATMGVGAAVFFIATPILAISTAVPHQRRKEILFRDLPNAYNFYVASNNK